MTGRPEPTEYAPYYEPYVALLPEGDVVHSLDEQRERLLSGFRAAPAEFAYADGKWTGEEVIGHIVDIERVFSYRAMCFTRGMADIGLAGVDQDLMVPASRATARGIASLAEEFDALRRANVVLFRSLDADQMDLVGTASGAQCSVRGMLAILYGHAEHHLRVLGEHYVTA